MCLFSSYLPMKKKENIGKREKKNCPNLTETVNEKKPISPFFWCFEDAVFLLNILAPNDNDVI